jgi:hypothetical protein
MGVMAERFNVEEVGSQFSRKRFRIVAASGTLPPRGAAARPHAPRRRSRRAVNQLRMTMRGGPATPAPAIRTATPRRAAAGTKSPPPHTNDRRAS